MKVVLRAYTLFVLLSLCYVCARAQGGFQSFMSYDDLTPRVQRLKNNANVTVRPLGQSFGKQNIWLIELNKTKDRIKPGLCIIGGVDGRYLYTVDMVVRLAEKFINPPDSSKSLLENFTLYFIPNANPDGLRQAFQSLKYERNGNDRPIDDDKDGRIDEDGFDDMNGDKFISWMRVEDSTGTWLPNPEDPRILSQADVKKGQKGIYKLYREGYDSDKDGRINEDVPGGVAFNRNFTFEYPWFQSESGAQSFSESETRALGDFLFNEWNVYSIFVFGPNNNLSPVWTYKSGISDGNIPQAIKEKDGNVYALASKLYNETVKAQKNGDTTAVAGDILRWGYFHYGRTTLGTPGWWPPTLTYKKDSALSEAENTRLKKRIESDNKYVKYLAWTDKQKITEQVFTPWKPIETPDFKHKKVEIGGFNPFSYYNPPFSALDSMVSTHFNFFHQLLKAAPQLKIGAPKLEKLAGDLYKIEVELQNIGLLPTDLIISEKFNYTKRIIYNVRLSDGQKIISGLPFSTTDILQSGEGRRFAWIIKGKGKVQIDFETPAVGKAETSLKLE